MCLLVRHLGYTAALFGLSLAAIAADSGQSTISFTTINQQSFQSDWGLTDDEFEQYRNYMASTGRYYYTHLDPLMVLGFIETDPGKRDRLAERYLIESRRRIEQELSFVQEIQHAQKRLFPSNRLYDFSKVAGYEKHQQKKQALERAVQISRARSVPRRNPINATISTYDWHTDPGVVSVEFLIRADCDDCEAIVRDLLTKTPETVIIDLYAPETDLAALTNLIVSLRDVIRPSRVISAKQFDPILFDAETDIERPIVRSNGVIVARL